MVGHVREKQTGVRCCAFSPRNRGVWLQCSHVRVRINGAARSAMPAVYLKLFIKCHKNDEADVKAICEAAPAQPCAS